MIKELFKGLNERGVSPVIAIVLLLMMTVAAAGAAYFWLTRMQSGIQKRSTKSIENIMQSAGRRLVAQGAICEPTAPEGMVAWYEFYEGKGNKTHDSSKNENIGTLHPSSNGEITADSQMWVEGKAGGAMEFDGNDSYVDVEDSDSLDITSSFTISAWVNYDPNQRDTYGVVAVKFASYGLSIHENGHVFIEFWNKTGSRHYKRIDYILSADSWYHITGKYEKGSSMKVYVNGKFKGESQTYDEEIATTTNPLRIAKRKASNYDIYNGTLDEVRIYDRVLSAEEVNETYKGKMKVKVTVRNVGSVEIPEAKFVANLKKDGTTVDSDTYTTTSSIETDDLKTLTFYFNEMRPGGSYNVNIPGIDVSQSVKCQSLE